MRFCSDSSDRQCCSSNTGCTSGQCYHSSRHASCYRNNNCNLTRSCCRYNLQHRRSELHQYNRCIHVTCSQDHTMLQLRMLQDAFLLPTALTVNAAPLTPAAPVASVTHQPTCLIATGTITVTSPAPAAGITFSIDGVTYTNTTGVFSALVPGPYNVTVKNAAGCVSAATALTVNAAPLTPQLHLWQVLPSSLHACCNRNNNCNLTRSCCRHNLQHRRSDIHQYNRCIWLHLFPVHTTLQLKMLQDVFLLQHLLQSMLLRKHQLHH